MAVTSTDNLSISSGIADIIAEGNINLIDLKGIKTIRTAISSGESNYHCIERHI